MYLIFDFDGVIGDTQDISAKATAAIEGISEAEAYAQNMPYASKKPNHTRDHTLTADELHKIYTWTIHFGDEMAKLGVPLFTDFVSIIESLPTTHKAVVSSGSQRYIIPTLATTTINPTHILAYENHHSKEEKIELIAKDWGVPVSEIYYFTDTLADVYELRNLIAPEKLIAVTWGHCSKEQLSEVLDAQHILSTPEDIYRVLP